jgi:hypothetical protein
MHLTGIFKNFCDTFVNTEGFVVRNQFAINYTPSSEVITLRSSSYPLTNTCTIVVQPYRQGRYIKPSIIQ